MTNPHSVLLGVLVELGLVGLALLLVVVGALLVATLRAWRVSASEARTPEQVRHVIGLLALASTLPAFAFDYYLLKNFGISFWWWLVFALLVGVPAVTHRGAHAATRSGATRTDTTRTGSSRPDAEEAL